MLTVDEIREGLKDRKLSVVAERTGVHVNTLGNLINGRNKTLPVVVEKLSNYLEGKS